MNCKEGIKTEREDALPIVFLKLEATLKSLKDPIKLDLHVVKSMQEPPENIEIVMETTNI